MKIVSVGGGPGGLYFSILCKQAFPQAQITIYERNRADDTFGWGVVFSDETLSNFAKADPPTYAEITRNFINWSDIHTYFKDSVVRSTGHGFCGLSRKKLLQIFHARCEQLGVKLVFEKEIRNLDQFLDADLVLGADGINSLVREKFAAHFKPSIEWGKCKFSWLGCDKQLEAFTFIFRENKHGLFQVHAYPFAKGMSTFIVECHEDTWKKSGLNQASEQETVNYFEELFADHLKGHHLLSNRSIWRSFPTVKNEKWHYKNVVLVGDAAHTAHFSIGSGTKLALEDAIALTQSLTKYQSAGMDKVLQAYTDERWLDCIKIQKAAQTSREWFENSRRYMQQHPQQFTFNLMTRSKQITYDNLQMRDPALIEKTAQWFDKSTPAPMFSKFRLGKLELQNRVVVSAMCQYSSEDGTPNDWHLVHLGSRAIGGAGLVFTEMTNVSREGRITYGCAGIYKEEHIAAWKKIVDFVHDNSQAKIGMQLGHAGRKGSCHLPWEGDDPLTDQTAWQCLAPSAASFDRAWHVPKEMQRAEMDCVREQYVRATQMVEQADFDLIEIHMAHGYLLSSFISPKANFRKDEYGGDIVKRMRFPLEIFAAVRKHFPAHKPVGVRISATDWLDEQGGLTLDESVIAARLLKEHGCDFIDVSSAGNTPESQPVYGRMYQIPFAEKIKYEVGIPIMAVGGIMNADHVNTILAAGRADLCALARPHLINPYITLGAAVKYQYFEQPWPKQYLPAKPIPKEPNDSHG